MRQRRARGVERRREIDRDDRVPFLGREALDDRGVLDAGIVAKDVDAAEAPHRIFDEAGDRGRLREVGAAPADLDAELRLDAGARLLDRLRLAEAVQHHVGALLGQRPCDREADAAGGAGNEGHFAFEHITDLRKEI
jgi:hypothetical protein